MLRLNLLSYILIIGILVLSGCGSVKRNADTVIPVPNLENLEIVQRLSTESNANFVEELSISPDSSKIIAGGVENAIHIWQLSDGLLLQKIDVPEGCDGSYCLSDEVVGLGISPDGSKLVSGTITRQVHIWSLDDFSLLKNFNNSDGIGFWNTDVTFHPSGRTFLVRKGKISPYYAIKDINDDQELKVKGYGGGSAVFSPDGNTIAMIVRRSVSIDATDPDQENSILLFQTSNGEFLREIVTLERLSAPTGEERIMSESRKIAFSPDGTKIASFGKNIRIWRVLDGELLQIFENEEMLLDMTFSPSGNILASGTEEGTIDFWGVDSGDLLHSILGHYEINDIEFSPDGTKVAISSGHKDYNNTVTIYATTGNEPLFVSMIK